MSRQLINRSSDLGRLENDGFEIEIKGGNLLVHGVPYVNSKGQIAYGTLVSKLDLAGEQTAQPEDHVIHFKGDHPCFKDGSKIIAIQNASETKSLGDGTDAVEINHTFSSKPLDRKYRDYHEKVTQYVKILSHEAQAIDPSVTAKSFKVKELAEPDSVFHYRDTNSSRAEIGAISAKLKDIKIAIIGLGGTGSYVLDFVAKTSVKEIHIFDGDFLLQHNAFRAPGATALATLSNKPKKVSYLKEVYSKMHKFVIPHDYNVVASNLNEVSVADFVFICVDKGEDKEPLIKHLLLKRIPFIDVGMGISAVDGALTGSARVTTCTAEKCDHVEKRISFVDQGQNDYSQNIQIAELNALNAALAVIKWKKIYGFYHDLEKEHHSSYSINMNKILSDETIT